MTSDASPQGPIKKIEDTYAVRTIANAVFGTLVAENWIDPVRFNEEPCGVYDEIKESVIRIMQRIEPSDIQEIKDIELQRRQGGLK